jgi:hypothetical protein
MPTLQSEEMSSKERSRQVALLHAINSVPKLYQFYQISNLLNYLLQVSINSSITLNRIIMEL